MGDIDENSVDANLIRDIRGDGTRPIGSNKFIVVNDGDEKLHKIYGQD
jgi:hypothetical protein